MSDDLAYLGDALLPFCVHHSNGAKESAGLVLLYFNSKLACTVVRILWETHAAAGLWQNAALLSYLVIFKIKISAKLANALARTSLAGIDQS